MKIASECAGEHGPIEPALRLTKQYSAPSMGPRPKSAVAFAASRWMLARMSCGLFDM